MDILKDLKSCCIKVYFTMKKLGLEPGAESFARHPDCQSALISMVRDIWVDECDGIADEWPWNDAYVLLEFIRVRKIDKETKKELEAKMEDGRLFPICDEGIIYFIRNSRNQIKIGWTKQEPKDRLKQLQTGEAEPLYLAAWMNGSMRQEKSLHVKFASFRVRSDGEWFYPNKELEDFIKDNRS